MRFEKLRVACCNFAIFSWTLIEATLNDKMKGKKFALQVDESTDISSKAQLLAFIRFVDGESIVNQLNRNFSMSQ